MRFVNPKCPKCGELAAHTVEKLFALAQINHDEETGEADYAGESEMLWDTQKPVHDKEDPEAILLHCEACHTEWPSRLIPEAEPVTP